MRKTKRKKTDEAEQDQCSLELPTVKLGIVGSRNFKDANKFEEHLKLWIQENKVPDFIISGGASGADTLAEKYAQRENIPLVVFRADWHCFGNAAGPIRNTEIVEECTHVLAFPSKKGSGTQDTIQKAKEKGKTVKIVYID